MKFLKTTFAIMFLCLTVLSPVAFSSSSSDCYDAVEGHEVIILDAETDYDDLASWQGDINSDRNDFLAWIHNSEQWDNLTPAERNAALAESDLALADRADVLGDLADAWSPDALAKSMFHMQEAYDAIECSEAVPAPTCGLGTTWWWECVEFVEESELYLDTDFYTAIAEGVASAEDADGHIVAAYEVVYCAIDPEFCEP